MYSVYRKSKLQEGQIDLDLPGYHQYWNYAEKKRLFRHSHVHKRRAYLCFLWPWH